MVTVKGYVIGLALASSSVAWLAARPQQAILPNTKDFVFSQESAYLLMPPEPVAGSKSLGLWWSSDGGYLLVARADRDEETLVKDAIAGQRTPNSTEDSLVVYHLLDKRNSVVWHARALSAKLGSVSWFSGSNRFVAVVDEPLRTEDPTRPPRSRQSILIFDADRGTSTTAISVVQEGGLPWMGVLMSPTRPYGIILSRSVQTLVAVPTAAASGAPPSDPEPAPAPTDYLMLRPDGTTTRIPVAANMSLSGWSKDGSKPVFVTFERSPDRKAKATWYEVDPATGKSEAMTKREDWEPVSNGEIDTALRQGEWIHDGKQEKIQAAWLDGSADKTKTVIAKDCSAVSLSPALNAVAYVSNGVSMVRPILRVPKRAFLTALKEALKAQAMSNAKQVGLATLMYSSDYDDVLPMQGMDMSDILGPYARNASIFEGFTYTYSGGSTNGMKDPAHTELGYTQGPGGRAVIYGDGHVQWVPDK
ncbi:MAG TPA: hypothetical protein VHE55_19790 [Fimbriimonadaceae bacterium]|nr:hypothetical protein [Fimbriimonadaceae bacterium]